MNPIDWAKKAVEVHGWRKAYQIVCTTGRPKLGEGNSVPNPYYNWYRQAKIWIQKNAEEDLNLPVNH